ncbi:MAG: transglutaminase family protein [Arenicellales bacterium]
MRLKISHHTSYHYDEPVQYALQQLRLTPKTNVSQKVISWSTTIKGGREEVEFDDHNNNRVVLISFEPGCQSVSFLSEGEVETTDTSGIIGKHGGYAPLWYFKRYTELTTPGPHVRSLVKELGNDFCDDVNKMHELSELVERKVVYETGRTDSSTKAEDTLEVGHGVCQDHTHVFICAVRLMGLPARYVSGYLMIDDRIDQEASHAWAEVYISDVGWIGFDVSNRISPDHRYVRVATGLDYREAAPISGMRYGDSSESMEVSLQVQQ